jgi:hypothetical protein
MKTFTKWIDTLFASLFGVLLPVAPIIYTLTLVIFADFIFGICRAKKMKETITSRKMSQSLPKILLYNSIILVLYFVDKEVLNTGIGLEKLGASLMIIMEMKSIDESFNTIFGYSLWNRLVESIERGKSLTKK